MKNKIACWTVALAALLSAGLADAQKMERPKDREPGDKATWKIVINNKEQMFEEYLTESTDEEVIGVQKIGGKEYEFTLGKTPPYQYRKAPCLPDGQQCTFSPGLTFVEFPLEKGKKWTTTFTLNAETYTAQVTQERQVERTETIKVPGGEFDTFKITYTGRVTGKTSNGEAFKGGHEGINWVALISGKLCIVKSTYKNTSGGRFAYELVSASFK
jgi:hypothetical protein